MKRQKATYLGNAKLRPSGFKHQYTKEQVEELVKCTEDPFYFIRKYVKIVSLDKGLIVMPPYPHQEKMITNFHNNRFTIFNCPRQIGKSTAYVAYLLWYTSFNQDKNVVLLANKAKTARDILSRYKLAYEHLPLWMQQGIKEWNKSSIELENRCKITADSTSGSAGRSGSISLLILDEFAFVPNNIANDFFRSVYPTITSGTTTKIIIVSTPNGMNLFYKLWMDATGGKNLYVPFTMHWSEVPGRDEKWKEETIKNMGIDSFRQEFELDFLGSTVNTLVAPTKLRNLAYVDPIYSKDELDIHENPVQGKQYVMCVDTARGDANDYSAFTVIDVTALPYKVVAKYRSNLIPTISYPNVIVDIAKKYNEAFLLIEINDTGSQVVDIIRHDLEYANLFTTVMDKKIVSPMASTHMGKRHKFGITTTKKVRNIGCSNLKSLVEDTKLIITDFDIMSELSTFKNIDGKFQAEEGCNDDLVMTLVLFGWLTGQKYFKDLLNQDFRNIITKKEDNFDDIPITITANSEKEVSMEVLDDGDLVITEEKTWNNDDWLYAATSPWENRYKPS
jgi:hypothetical protein